ncbi:MAG: RecQ family ATP-dependent DNA helicase [Phycisphaerales bacterium]|nr:RecQ family ATP-dependent DNA helicase [Phycisphaerales bacterium]
MASPGTSTRSAPAGDDLAARVPELLRRYWGFDTLRPLQIEAIRAGVTHRDSLVVLPTGGGKSLCYQVPPLLTGRLTVVVSPLISLMKDQVDGLRLANYPAAAMHSGVSGEEMDQVRRRAVAGELRLLFVAPERLLNSSFISFLRRADVGSFAIDEAHCISQWGHDFRPEYRRLAELRTHFPGLAIHAYTATATPRVRSDIAEQLRLREPEVLVGVFDRPNLTYRVLPRISGIDQVVGALNRHKGRAAIVYCISRKDTERLAEVLTERGLEAGAYHAGLSPTVRQRVQDRFATERLDIVVATVAFGMGIDRSDVRCVVHASMPKTVEHYQQETGRAGRDGLASECVLFYSAADVLKWKRLMEMAAENADAPPDPANIRAQHELLGHMQNYCASARCRHRALSAYFGQEYAPPPPAPSVRQGRADRAGGDGGCGACDVCLNELAAVADSATIAKKIISCVYRLRQSAGFGFGAGHVAEVLRGAMTAKVLRRGHENLSTFGLLRTLDKERLASYINQLIDRGGLVREPGEFATLALGPESGAILRDRLEVTLFDPRSVAAPAARKGRGGAGIAGASADSAPPLSAEEQGVFEALRALRRAIAEEKGVPAYLIFGDVTLEELARARPGTVEAFARIRGVGRAKLEEFGERFVRNIQAYCREHKLTLDAAAGSRPRPRSTAPLDPDRPLSESRGRAFEMYTRGASTLEVAAAVHRAPSTAEQYLAEFIVRTRPASIAAWVDDDTYRLIAGTADRLGESRLKPIREHLGEGVTCIQIRAVLSHRRALGAGAGE